MKFTYRGITYENEPVTFEMKSEKIVGKYRGVRWRQPKLNGVLLPEAIGKLKYRGAYYLHVVWGKPIDFTKQGYGVKYPCSK
ncbi:DUF4278 domain-containing protein [Moorena sp. SIO3H5]|uniref:DUF4278 domain-containing protein n=1 Tax=Moorena sp. SIO3H5 TaxID=2607834 RepID=UPI0013BD2BA4|nr:DUF4278 domain-containing protein [Moorena sp. SIO3H5]NEO73806.1 DUF4278 domain-containing protein [Moorena sp. SIO3H5]